MPGETSNDRRAVPRHIRDGEHDTLDEAMSREPRPGRAAGRRMWLWIYAVVLLAGGFGLWISLRSSG